MRNTSLLISHKQLLALGHLGRVNGVTDWCPERRAEEEECERRPKSVCNEPDEDISYRLALGEEDAVGSEDDGDEGEVDEDEVEDGHVVEEDGPEAAEHVLLVLRVALVEGVAEGACGLECYDGATEPCGEDEGPDDGEGDVRGHPELIATISLSGVVTCWGEEREFAEAITHECSEAGTDQPAELFEVGIGDEGFTPYEHDGNGKEGDGHEDGEHS